MEGTHKKNVVAFIPARGGSKGIPRKNIALLGGKPLIAYTIEAARRAFNVDRVVVSTEDCQIAEMAVKWGAEIPCLRPPDLAGDKSDLRSAMFHMMDFLEDTEDFQIDILVTLFVTYPFRSYKDVEQCVKEVEEGALLSATVSKPRTSPYRCFEVNGGHAHPLVDQTRMQNEISNDLHVMKLNTSISANPAFPRFIRDLKDFSLITKAFNEYSAHLLKTENYSGEYFLHEVDRIRSIDIDSPAQLTLAERVLQSDLFDFDRGMYES